jgi:N-acetylglutamate synthase-like GNAT family acetyltransferase
MNQIIENNIKIISHKEEFNKDFKEINYEWLEKYFTITELDKKAFNNPKKEILDKEGYIYLAIHNNTPIGSVALEKINDKQYALTRMGVKSEYQGKKVGQSLMKIAIEKCNELKLESVVLYTNQILINALNLYFQNGFKIVELDYVPYERATIKMKLKF